MSKDDRASRRVILSKRRAKLPATEQALLEKLLQGESNIEDEMDPQRSEQSPALPFFAQLPDLPSRHADPIEHLAPVLRHKAVSSSSLVPIQTGNSDKRPLFFVHPVSGDVSCYTDLARRLGPDRPFYGLRSQGLDGEQPPQTQVETMASHYVELLRTVQAEGPYLLGGWSMGGVVAFEMAQQLRAQDQTAALLALIDSYRPMGDLDSKPDWANLLTAFALDLGLTLRRIKLDWPHLEQLEPNEQLNFLLERAKQTNLLPADTDPACMPLLFQVFRSNAYASRSYVPVSYPGPLTLFKASDQFDEFDEDLGWGELVAEDFMVQSVPGNHHTIVREPNVEFLAEKINHCLHTTEGGNKET